MSNLYRVTCFDPHSRLEIIVDHLAAENPQSTEYYARMLISPDHAYFEIAETKWKMTNAPEDLTEGRTIWNSDGTEGPALICVPPEKEKS